MLARGALCGHGQEGARGRDRLLTKSGLRRPRRYKTSEITVALDAKGQKRTAWLDSRFERQSRTTSVRSQPDDDNRRSPQRGLRKKLAHRSPISGGSLKAYRHVGGNGEDPQHPPAGALDAKIRPLGQSTEPADAVTRTLIAVARQDPSGLGAPLRRHLHAGPYRRECFVRVSQVHCEPVTLTGGPAIRQDRSRHDPKPKAHRTPVTPQIRVLPVERGARPRALARKLR